MSSDFVRQAVVVCTGKKDAVSVAFNVTLANNDVAVAVNLCGVHGSLSFVVTGNDLL
jgi:hydroxyethylthiazole kinase-like sugar kinase family protein